MRQSRLEIIDTLQKAYNDLDNFDTAATNTLRILCETTRWVYGELWLPSEDNSYLTLEHAYYADPEIEAFCNKSKEYTFVPGVGIPGRVWETKQSEWWPDVTTQSSEIYPRKELARQAGLHAAYAAPVMRDHEVVAVLLFNMREPREKDEQFALLISIVTKELSNLMSVHETKAQALQARAELEALFEQLPVGVYRATLDGYLIEGNSRLFELFAVSDLELVKDVNVASVYVSPDDETPIREELVESGESVDREFQLKRADGVPIWVRNSTKLIRDPSGEPIYVQGVIQDITESKTTQDALTLSEQRYKLLFERNQAGVFHSTFEGKLVDCNEAFARILGYESPADAKSVPTVRYYTDPQVREQTLALLKEHGGYDNFEAELQKKDGTPIWVVGSARVINLGDSSSFLGTIIDISDRKRAEEQAHRLLQQLQALHEIDIAIASSLDLRLTLNVVQNQIITTIDPDAVVIRLYNPKTQELYHAVSHGFRTEQIKSHSIRLGEGMSGKAALKREIIEESDLANNAHVLKYTELIGSESFVACIAVPLIAKGELQGVLTLLTRANSQKELTPEKRDFAKAIAHQAAIAINNATLFENLQQTNIELQMAYDATLEGWAKALELRDRGSSGHSRRLVAMTVAICRKLGISDEELVHIRRGALLHDIGKMAIPDDILNKPGPLNNEEMEVMKKHPEYAQEWISSFEFLLPSIDIPYCHHEHWDGSGYPRGLREEQIPLSARVFSVADAWDAMTHDRPYRDALTHEEAIAELERNSGTQFDPEIVELFISMLENSEI